MTRRKIIVTDSLIYILEGTGSEVALIRPGEILRASLRYRKHGSNGAIFMTLDKEDSEFIIETSSLGLTDNRGLRDLRSLLLGNGYREAETLDPDEAVTHLIKPGRLMRDNHHLCAWAKNDWTHLLTIFSDDMWARLEAACGDLMEDGDAGSVG